MLTPKVSIFYFMAYYVYILQSQTNRTFYKGSTDNLVRRINDHNQGRVTFSSKFRPWNLVWFTTKNTRAEAVALEMKLKNLSAIRLEEFMKKYPITDQHGFVIVDVINQV
jgi:putative endonuclease